MVYVCAVQHMMNVHINSLEIVVTDMARALLLLQRVMVTSASPSFFPQSFACHWKILIKCVCKFHVLQAVELNILYTTILQIILQYIHVGYSEYWVCIISFYVDRVRLYKFFI